MNIAPELELIKEISRQVIYTHAVTYIHKYNIYYVLTFV